ncbi:MAG: hypothetical protein LC740_07855, partial [Actinobacteria bacterium]|nr:hypothetical protein [Actinomycetota bacterium]
GATKLFEPTAKLLGIASKFVRQFRRLTEVAEISRKPSCWKVRGFQEATGAPPHPLGQKRVAILYAQTPIKGF